VEFTYTTTQQEPHQDTPSSTYDGSLKIFMRALDTFDTFDAAVAEIAAEIAVSWADRSIT
jgi:hypothetical protein